MRKSIPFVLAIAGIAVVAMGCFPQNQCAGSFADYCKEGDTAPCFGHLVDPHHWESGPFLGAWQPFNNLGMLLMHLRDAQTGAQLEGNFGSIECYISATQTPNQPGNQFVASAGNLCELNVVPEGAGWQASVLNGTCAEYFVYVTMSTL